MVRTRQLRDTRHRHGLTLVLLLGAVGLAGHALAEPRPDGERETFVTEVRQRFPESQFIVGVGESDLSAAGAESRAVADVAAAIRSSVERTFRAVEQGSFGPGVARVDLRTLDEIQQKVETTAGAHIHPRRELTRRIGGGWLAAATASRAELDARYVTEAGPLTSRLSTAQDRILSSRSWIEGAPAWCEIRPLEARIQLLSQERLAVSGKVLWTPELQERSRQVGAVHGAARSTLRVNVMRLPDGGEEDPSDRVVKAVRKAGWEAGTAGEASCSPGGLILQPVLSRECRRTAIGLQNCEVALRIEGRACDGGKLLFTASRSATGSDSRDAARAERAARKKLEVAAVADDAAARTLGVLGECSP